MKQCSSCALKKKQSVQLMAVSNIDLLAVLTGSTFYFVLLYIYMYTTDFLQFYMYNWELMCS